jgi:dynein heavy chain
MRFHAYLGPFNKEFREKLLIEYFEADLKSKKVPVTKNLNVIKMLATDGEIGEWNIQGLPTDDLSTQNGILALRAARWPLMIDPQGQGRSWIINRETPNGLKVVGFADKMFRFNLEDALTFGKPLLIENIEEDVDPLMDPILEKVIVKQGKSWKIALADKELDYTETFKLFMTSRLPNPHYTPETQVKVSILNFAITPFGLEE